MPIAPRLPIAATLLTLALAGCAKEAQIELVNDSIGLRMTRSACPAVGIPSDTGDLTLFDPPASRVASAIDVVATMSDVRTQCTDSGSGPLPASVSFQVEARRTATTGARDVVVPYFATAVRGAATVVSKQIGQVALHFADGQATASGSGTAAVTIDRAAVSLPVKVADTLRRKRRASDADASIDPMNDPEVRQALARASFELLVGFQLTNDQLAYNATR